VSIRLTTLLPEVVVKPTRKMPTLSLARFILLVLTFTAAGCASAPRGPDAERLFGTWRWVSSIGGIAGRPTTPDLQGYSVRYRFQANGILEVVRDDSVTDRTRFRIGQRSELGGAPRRTVLRYDKPVNVMPPPLAEQYLRFQSPDTLVLGDTCADCFEHTFVRVR
jgi:hypothetical protein